jgi:hypothetical protein
MKRVLVVFVPALVAAGVALAAVTRQDAAGPPTSASLMACASNQFTCLE